LELHFFLAPEIILNDKGYNVKVDIWSLGISIIETAELTPPYSDCNPMRAVFLITSNPPPALAEPTKWSKELNELIHFCLQKDSRKRFGAEQVLDHAFITNANRDDSSLKTLFLEGKAIPKKGLTHGHLSGIKTESEGEVGSQNSTPSDDSILNMFQGTEKEKEKTLSEHPTEKKIKLMSSTDKSEKNRKINKIF